MTYKARKRWAIVVLILGLPAYIIACVFAISLFERPPIWLEFVIYVALGIVWALPLRRLFRGIGQPDPDEE